MKVNLGLVGIAPEAGFYVAMERGYFKQEGLDVQHTRLSGTAQIPLLASGKLDLGTGSPNPGLFNAIARGIALKIVAPSVLQTKDDKAGAFLVRTDHFASGRYKEPRDLKGMTIALQSFGNTTEMCIEKLLARGNLTEADVTMKSLAYPDAITALTNKAIDAAMSVEPFISKAVNAKIARIIAYQTDLWPNGLVQAILLAPEFGQQHAEAAKRFVTAHLKANREVYFAMIRKQGGQEDIARIINKYLPVADPMLYTRIGQSGIDPNGAIGMAPLAEAQDYFLKKGTQQKEVDLNTVVDDSYIKYALDRLGTVQG